MKRKWIIFVFIVFSLVFFSCKNKPYSPSAGDNIMPEKPVVSFDPSRSIEGKLQRKDNLKNSYYFIYSPSNNTSYYLKNPNPALIKLAGERIFIFEGAIQNIDSNNTVEVQFAKTISVEKVLQRSLLTYFGKIQTSESGSFVNYKIDQQYLPIYFKELPADFSSQSVYRISGKLFYDFKEDRFYINDPEFIYTEFYEARLVLRTTYATSSQCKLGKSFYNSWDEEKNYYDSSKQQSIPSELFQNLARIEYKIIYTLKYQGICDSSESQSFCRQIMNLPYNFLVYNDYLKEWVISSANYNYYVIINDCQNIINKTYLKYELGYPFSGGQFSSYLRVILKPNEQYTYYGTQNKSRPTIYSINYDIADNVRRECPNLEGPVFDLVSVEDVEEGMPSGY